MDEAESGAATATPGRGSDPTRPARAGSRVTEPPRPSTLIVNYDVPPLDRDSGSLRLRRLIRLLLQRGERVTLVALGGSDQRREIAELTQEGVEVVALDRGGATASGEATGGWVRLLSGRRFELAIICRYEVARDQLPAVRLVSPGCRVAIDTVDLHWLRLSRAAGLAEDPKAPAAARRAQAEELAVYDQADVVIAISEREQRLLEAQLPGKPVVVISNVHQPIECPRPFEARSGFVFLGFFGHDPNADAILAFHRHCWPIVRTLLPSAKLEIVGHGPPPEVVALAGRDVAVVGGVPEVAPHLDRARVMVAPIRYGAGVKGKIGEALARGLPVVTTTVGAEGMEVQDGKDLLIRDDPIQFAKACAELHDFRWLWRRLSEAGRATVARTLGEAAALRGIEELLKAARQPARG